VTTFYNKELKVTQSFAIADFQPGEQVFIFYGPRSNEMFLVYQGFVFAENNHDIISYYYPL
jgi:histone-lysine N-methyltransferase SETD3